MEYPFVIDGAAGRDVVLPAMYEVHQQFDALPEVDAREELTAEWPRAAEQLARLRPGASIAVAVGSRGITGIADIVRDVVARLRVAGCDPFIVPAMGSHGGATAEGQTGVLASLGVTEEVVGAPVHATMEVVSLGEADGIPLYLDRFAWEADGIVLINRVKPHTDFHGHVESGLMKMIVIGLGKQAGAEHYHRLSVVRGLADTVPVAARALLERANVVFGVALVENEEHRTAAVRVVPPEEIEEAESVLLDLARWHLPDLPVDDIDLLILDEMGKEISGNGLDPNVTGRNVTPWAAHPPRPRVSRIFVRRLTEASHGNACGLACVDAVPARFLERFDYRATLMNGFTSAAPEDGRMPMVFAADRDAVTTLLTVIRPTTPEDVRVVYARNTLEVARLWVSAGCLPVLRELPACTVDGAPRALEFDAAGSLLSPFARA
jgi:hypothetical protein